MKINKNIFCFLLLITLFMLNASITTLAKTNVNLHIITRDDIADSELQYMTKRLTAIPAYNFEVIKHNYQKTEYPELTILPAYFFSAELANEKEAFNVLVNSQLIVTNTSIFKEKTYQANPGAYMPSIYLANQPESSQLELFYRPYCPFGLQALKSILEGMQAKKTPVTNLVLTPLARIKNINSNSDNLSKKYYMSKGLPEIEETVRELVIYKYWPEKLLAYIQERAANLEFPWAKAAQSANINIKELVKAVDTEGESLLEAGVKRNSKYRIQSSPSYLWENQRLFNTTNDLIKLKEFKDLQLPNGTSKCS